MGTVRRMIVTFVVIPVVFVIVPVVVVIVPLMIVALMIVVGMIVVGMIMVVMVMIIMVMVVMIVVILPACRRRRSGGRWLGATADEGQRVEAKGEHCECGSKVDSHFGSLLILGGIFWRLPTQGRPRHDCVRGSGGR